MPEFSGKFPSYLPPEEPPTTGDLFAEAPKAMAQKAATAQLLDDAKNDSTVAPPEFKTITVEVEGKSGEIVTATATVPILPMQMPEGWDAEEAMLAMLQRANAETKARAEEDAQAILQGFKDQEIAPPEEPKAEPLAEALSDWGAWDDEDEQEAAPTPPQELGLTERAKMEKAIADNFASAFGMDIGVELDTGETVVNPEGVRQREEVIAMVEQLSPEDYAALYAAERERMLAIGILMPTPEERAAARAAAPTEQLSPDAGEWETPESDQVGSVKLTQDDEPDPEDLQPLEQPRIDSVLNNSLCISVTLGRYGNTRKLNANQIEVDADKASISASKKLLDSPTLTAIGKMDGEIRRTCYEICLPVTWLAGRAYLIPIASVEKLVEKLRDYQKRRAALVDQFVSEYEALVKEARERLRGVFDPNDYRSPRSVRRDFQFTWEIIEIAPPRQGALSKELYEIERQKQAERWSSTAREIQDALRAAALKLASQIRDRMEPSPDGKKKIFKDSTVDNLMQFLENFNARNLTNDTELASVIEQARSIMKGIDVKDLRKSEPLRQTVAAGFAKIEETLKGLQTIDAPARQIEVDEDED